MGYPTNYAEAARRHLQAGLCLHDAEPAKRRPDVAGYLYGIAAECALKQIMRRSYSREAPEHAHFPVLKTILRDNAQGRYAGVLRRFAEDGAFMSEWDIAMRYAGKADIAPVQVERWREHAKQAIAQMERC
jgi:hypothetical protein